MRLRLVAATCAVAAAVFGAPIAAHANYCESPYLYFSRAHTALPATIPAPDPVGPIGGINASSPLAYGSAYCLADNSDTLGEEPNRFIPGANQFQIRRGDISASVPSIDVVLNGGPFQDTVVTLTRGVGNSTGVMTYDSAWIDLGSGDYCIHLTQADLEEEGHVSTFGGTC